MRHILARCNVERLEACAGSNTVVAFDFDGTLAPLVADPARARMRDSTRRLLHALTRHYPVGVISGRARGDVLGKLGSVRVRHVSGNHGIEPWGAHPRFEPLVSDWHQRLAAECAGWPGVVVEHKTYSLTVHYRTAIRKAATADRIRPVARELDGARTIEGHDSLAIVPVAVPHKGMALELTRRHLSCDTAIYVGDDETDEDVFRGVVPERVLTIRVGVRRRSYATYALPSQAEVDTLLARLLALRRHAVPARRGVSAAG